LNLTVRLLFSCLLLTIIACSEPTTSPSPTAQTPGSESTLATESAAPEFSLQLALAQVKSGEAILVDVREQDEWDEKHFVSAVHIPVSTLQQDISAVKDLDKSKRLYTHCRAGGRATKMANMLKENGFNVVPLKFSFEELVENGFMRHEK